MFEEIKLSEEAYKKMLEADEAPINYAAIEKFKAETSKFYVRDKISNFTLVFYFDKDNDKLQHVEYYTDNCQGDIETDVSSYKYGYHAIILRPEHLINRIGSLKLEEEIKDLKKFIKQQANNYCEWHTEWQDTEEKLKQVKQLCDYTYMGDKYNQLAKEILSILNK